MSAPSNNHRILCELAALFCRVRWSCWPCGIEAVGLTKRNYDVIALKASPRAIIGMEVKVSRQDFLAGIRKKHFDRDHHITEMWLVYPGTFRISELPYHIGILKPRVEPICAYHEQLGHVCTDECNKKKNVFLEIVREAQSYGDKEYVRNTFSQFAPKWLWKIATSNTTKLLNIIESNVVIDFGDEPVEEIRQEK